MDQLSLRPEPHEVKPKESGLAKMRRVFESLSRQQRIAVLAALVLVLSELLPWYSGSLVLAEGTALPLRIGDQRSGLGAFSLVELALLITSVSILTLIYLRTEGLHKFTLPISDSTLITGAGLWSVLLIIYRMFDRPEVQLKGISLELGLSWGVFIALGAAALLAITGLRWHSVDPTSVAHLRPK